MRPAKPPAVRDRIRRFRFLLKPAVLVLAVFVAGVQARAQLPLTAVVTDQTPLDLSNNFGIPAASGVDQLGNFAFIGRGNSALFLRCAGSAVIERLLQAGDAVPGFPGSVSQSIYAPGVSTLNPGTPIASGRLAFWVNFTLADASLHEAILIYDGVNFHTAVSSDDIAPDSGGKNYGTVFPVAINSNGDIAFNGGGFFPSLSLTGPVAGPSTYLAPFGEAPLKIVAPKDASPDLPGNPPTSTGTFSSVTLEAMNDSRQVLFYGTDQVEQAFFLWSGTGIERVFFRPISTGPPPSPSPFPNASLSPAGEVARVDSSVAALEVYSSATGLLTVVPSGSAAPAVIGGTLQPAVWSTDSPLGRPSQSPPAINAAGDILFASLVSGSQATGLALLRRRADATLEAVAYAGQPAPGTNGRTFGYFTGGSIGPDGKVSFATVFTQGGFGIYQQAGASPPVLVAADYDAAPLLPIGFITLSGSPDTREMDDGSIYFRSTASSGDAYYSEFRGTPGSLTTLMSTAQSLPAGAKVNLAVTAPTVRKSFVVFIARKLGGGLSLFVRNLSTGVTTRVAGDGDLVPGTSGRITTDWDLSGITPTLDDQGETIFTATTSQGRSVFKGSTSGGLVKIAAPGDAAPGFGGATFLSLTLITDANASGQVLFTATLSDLSSGVFVWSPDGRMRRVPGVGDTVSDGSTIASASGPALINDAGDVLFWGTTSTGARGVFVWSGGVSRRVVMPGDVASGVPLLSLSILSMTGDDTVLFSSTIPGGLSSGEGIFLGRPDGSVETVAKTGDLSPAGGNFLGDGIVSSGTGGGGISFVSNSLVFPWNALMNREGDLAFRSLIGNSLGFASSGIFRRMQSGPLAGTIQSAVLAGQALPGGIGQLGAFGVASVFSSSSPNSFALGPDGSVAFVNSYVASGGASNQGAFFSRTDGTLAKIIAAGDAVPGTGGVLSSLGNSITVDDQGELILSAQASGGTASQAVVLARLQSGTQGDSTSLISSLNPALAGQTVQFTAAVTSSDGGTVTGTVNFVDGGTLLGSAQLDGTGKAIFSTSSLSAASHATSAQYAGDGSFSASASPDLTQVVNLRQTTTAVASSLNPAVGGQSMTFTATVGSAAGGTPTGTVRFFDNGAQVGTGALDGAGSATWTSASFAVGAHSITVEYPGDFTFAASTSAAAGQTVRIAGFAPPPGPMMVAAGQTVNIPLTLFAASGSGLNFTLSVSGLPAHSSATFSSNPVTPATPPAGTTIQLTLVTQAGSGALPPQPFTIPRSRPLGVITVVVAAFAALLIRLAGARRLAVATGLATLLLGVLLVGCSGSNSSGDSPSSNPPVAATTKGAATLTVTAVSGATNVTTDIPIVVQ